MATTTRELQDAWRLLGGKSGEPVPSRLEQLADLKVRYSRALHSAHPDAAGAATSGGRVTPQQIKDAYRLLETHLKNGGRQPASDDLTRRHNGTSPRSSGETRRRIPPLEDDDELVPTPRSARPSRTTSPGYRRLSDVVNSVNESWQLSDQSVRAALRCAAFFAQVNDYERDIARLHCGRFLTSCGATLLSKGDAAGAKRLFDNARSLLEIAKNTPGTTTRGENALRRLAVAEAGGTIPYWLQSPTVTAVRRGAEKAAQRAAEIFVDPILRAAREALDKEL